MSISNSLSNALSGLSAAARGAEVVSSNVSNALTEGYGRRELDLSSRNLAGRGAGVQVTGLRRDVDQQILGDRRLADASLAETTAQADFLEGMLSVLGQPENPESLTGRLSKLEAGLIEAASRPDSEPRLRAVLDSAEQVADGLNAASDRVQALRMQADREIAGQVGLLNEGLERVARLNHEIQSQTGAGRDAASLMDLRQQEIDRIASIVPIREVPRDRGGIALFTPGGAILVDGRAATIEFSPVGMIVPGMTEGPGSLSGLTVNGQPISLPPSGPLAGGSLAGSFVVRDQLSVSTQAKLDVLARDLIERFAESGSPGLFTTQVPEPVPADDTGLSSRIAINAAVVPERGGALWRLRDGLAAPAPGEPGNSSRLNGLAAALTTPRQTNFDGAFAAPRSAVGLAGDILSLLNGDLQASESAQVYSRSRVEALKTMELETGVDTDHEMQQLLLIEQAYSANARVISTADEMIQTLLGI